MKLDLLLRVIELFNKKISDMQKRKNLKQREIQQVEQEIVDLNKKREEEVHYLGESLHFLNLTHAYLDNIKLQIKQHHTQLEKLSLEKQKIEQQIIELHVEQKKYSILHQQGSDRLEAYMQAQEAKALDEFSINLHRRVKG